MLTFVLIIVCFVVVLNVWRNKLFIRFDTIFRKGFPKRNDKYGVYCFTGKMGNGKTYSATDFILETCKKSKKKVITNIKSLSDNYKSFMIYNSNFYDIIEKFEDGTYSSDYIIFYDELFTLLEKGKLNKKILSFISQLRKRDIYLITTVQEWLEINVTFRRYCRFYIECSMINIPLFNFAISINQIHDGYNMRWNNDINEYESPIILTTIKKCSLNIANSYDTFEVIATDYTDDPIHKYIRKNYKNY